jgi:hypothetical protein
MKIVKKIPVRLLVSCLSIVAVCAQDAPVPVPKYDGVFYRYDRTSGALVDLEHQQAAAASKPKALGLSGYKVFFYLRGGRSPVRFKTGDPIEFVVSLPLRTDPQTIQFVVLRPGKDRRELVESESNRPSPLGVGQSHNVLDRSEVPFEIKQFSESSYRLIPFKPLPAGEYCFSFSTNNVAYAFGVDAP